MKRDEEMKKSAFSPNAGAHAEIVVARNVAEKKSDDDSDDDSDDESDLLGSVKTAASVVVVSVVVFAPFSLFENDQKRTRMPFASFFPKEKSFSVLGDIVVV